MSQKSIMLQVPALPGTLPEINANYAHFGHGNGKELARKLGENLIPWTEDHIVWLQPVEQVGTQMCLHSLYRQSTENQSGLITTLDAYGLFCLAAHLQATSTKFESLTGLIYAFGATYSGQATVISTAVQGIAHKSLAMYTPMLYVTGGHTRSIYVEDHATTPETETKLFVAYSGSTLLFNLEEERQRIASQEETALF